ELPYILCVSGKNTRSKLLSVNSCTKRNIPNQYFMGFPLLRKILVFLPVFVAQTAFAQLQVALKNENGSPRLFLPGTKEIVVLGLEDRSNVSAVTPIALRYFQQL